MGASRLQRSLAGQAAVLTAGLVLSCGQPKPPVAAIADEDSPFGTRRTVLLSRPVHAESIFVVGDTFYLTEGRPEKIVSRWSMDGRELPRPLSPGSGPGELLQAADSFLRFPDGLLGILDYRSYRVNIVEAATARFMRSFVVSPYDIMALNGVGDPDRGLLYLFIAVQSPEVRVLDLDGLEVRPGFDYFDELDLHPYSRFRAVLDHDGNLYYCPRSWYKVLRVTPDGEASAFAEREGGSYRRPFPIPEWTADTGSVEKRREWEAEHSWVRQLAVSGDRLLVSYSVPPGFERHVVDVYDSDGRLVRGEVAAPGRLLGCEESGECWFLADADRRRLTKVELP